VVNLNRIFEAAGEILQGASDVAVVHNWLSMDDEGALRSVQTQVQSSQTPDIDRLDATLLSMAAGHPERDVRLRLVKLYAVFKTVETLRYETFRGFPA
jgi:hypothetical protein